MAKSMTIEEAVDFISEAVEAVCWDKQDHLKAMLQIKQAICPASEDPVTWAFENKCLELGHRYDLCPICAGPMTHVGDETFCPVHDARILVKRLQKEAV